MFLRDFTDFVDGLNLNTYLVLTQLDDNGARLLCGFGRGKAEFLTQIDYRDGILAQAERALRIGLSPPAPDLRSPTDSHHPKE